MKTTTLLVPTYNRAGALAVTLTSLCFQEDKDFDIVISDQSETDSLQQEPALLTAIRLLENRGHQVRMLRNLPARGMAQQRQFLLDQAHTPYCLFLDDDLILEPYVVGNLRRTLEAEGCGFAGAAVIGLSYQHDVRPHQQAIEFWEGKVTPETIVPQSREWQRYVLHNAANPLHLEQRYGAERGTPRRYKVAWVGGCVMYDTEKLRAAGGFGFWPELPEKHCGEDALAQLRVMKKYGGCGILPSGVYHQEWHTTIPERRVNAPEYLEI